MEETVETKSKISEELPEFLQQLNITKTLPMRMQEVINELIASESRYRRLFETAQDGILILDAETGHINDVNPYLLDMLQYSHAELSGKKLWEISPFKDTVLNQEAFVELQANDYIRYEDLPLEKKTKEIIPVEFISNIYEVDGKRVIQCNIRDISARKRAEERLKRKTENLEETNTALKVLLKQVEDGRGNFEGQILANIKELVLPYIMKLKNCLSSEKCLSLLSIIELNLNEIASSFLQNLKLKHQDLTPREIDIATLVKEGKSTKDIADLLCITTRTVEFHRNSLRDKLGLKNRKINLRSHLLTIQ